MLPKVRTYLRIASFFNNQFGNRLKFNAEFLDEILERMRAKRDIENSLAVVAEEKGWLHKKIMFSISSDDILNFPEMIEKDRVIEATRVEGLLQITLIVG